MTEQSENNAFYGYLGRAVITSDRADLRFYEYDFSTEPDAKPVFVVQFTKPGFGEDEISALLDCEVEVEVFEDRAEMKEVYGNKFAILRGTSVSADRTVYDTEDYVRRVRQLDALYARQNVELVSLRKKILEGRYLINELLRRAEIKAAASEELRQRQTAAIAVLERLLSYFENEV